MTQHLQPLAIQPMLAIWGLSAVTWLVMWSILAGVTVLLLIVLRTRWSRAKPWRKYAILSLWVHVLLACAAMTVKIVAGAPEAGSDQPIRVAVLPITLPKQQEKVEQELTPEWEQPDDSPLIAPELSPPEPPEPAPTDPGPDTAAMDDIVDHQEPETPLPPAPPLEAPSLMPVAEPVETVPDEPKPQVTPTAEPSEAPEQKADAAQQPEKPVAQPVVEKTYANRFAKNREQVIVQNGGSPQTEKAVRAALGWLANAQAANGGWNASQFGGGEERVVLGHDRHGAGTKADTGVTGLALLAFLGSGHTHRHGSYTHEVASGLEYLRQRQRADGSLYGDAQLFARMYCHSMATFAVCEALALTHDERLEPMATSAVSYALSMQHPTDGGWRYRRGDTGDTSQLGWQLMVLKSAEVAGIAVPEATWTRVERFMRRVKRGKAGGLACYRPETPASRTMTAEALFCRQLLASRGAAGLSRAASAEAIDSISQEPPNAKRRNLYFWYYATLALHRENARSPSATEAWENWNQALTSALLTTQQDDGSWDTNTTWGGYGGRVYTTALSALCLEVYYRYSPTVPSGELADREHWHPVQR